MKGGLRAFFPFLCLLFLSSGTAWGQTYYQLRDVSGERNGHTVAGSQWFATVLKERLIPLPTLYKSTVGGEAPDVPMVTSADLISGFNGVYLDDPLRGYQGGNIVSFDIMESVYLVVPEGRGALNIDFGNNFAYHSYFTPQDAMEDILLSVPGYATRVDPMAPQLVASGDYLHTTMTFQAESPGSYGSAVGYLTFRQSASFDTGFTGYRESIKIPLVVADVYDGAVDEGGNAFYVDMALFDSGDVVTRKKFRWAAQDMTQDLGTFFVMQPAGNAMPVYDLITRVTNRTGTRYRAQRYDYPGSVWQDIRPRAWAYDLTPDLYGTLPATFLLDAQSQIAPGLVSIYNSSVDLAYGTGESFRLYPYAGAGSAGDLRLTFRRIGGMSAYGGFSASGTVPPWSVTAFDMTFADLDTARQISNDIGGTPVRPASGYAFTGVADRYIKADALSSFRISSGIPSGLVGSGDVALLPVRIRMRLSRHEAPLVGIWNDLEDADSVIDAFASVCTVWVRSDAAAELDMNLFTTLRSLGSSPSKCIQAFTYEDYLYLDFVVLLADAVSSKTGKTAFCRVVEDDGVSCILIGDGHIDGVWDLSFYVALTGDNPLPDTDPDPNESPSDGGGGCRGGRGVSALLLAIPGALRRRVYNRVKKS